MKAPQSITAALERWALQVSQEVVGTRDGLTVATYAIVGVGILVWTSEDPAVFILSRPAGDATIALSRLDWFCAAAVIEQARHFNPKTRINQ